MAKQNVSFLERQLEKIVGGVAGAALLFVLVTNLLMSPHTVDVGGQSMGPAPFYAELAMEAEDARERMRRASPPDPASNPGEGAIAGLPKPVEMPPVEGFTSIVPPGQPIPDVEEGLPEIRYGEKVELAAIPAPPQPALSVGKAAARLAVPRIEQIGAMQDGTSATDDLAPTSDLHWVTGAAVFNRKAQRDLFVAAGYLPERQDVIVAELRVERREQQTNGVWSDPVVVRPYMKTRVVGKAEVGLVAAGADYELMPGEDEFIRRFRDALATKEAQERVLRPEFQSFLADSDPAEDDRFAWVIPRTLKAADETEIDMTDQDFGVEFREEPGTVPGIRPVAGGPDDGLRPGPRAPGARPVPGQPVDGPQQGANAIRLARENMTKAKEAIEKKNWTAAKPFLDEIVTLTGLPETHPLKKEAAQMLRAYRADFERAELLANRLQASPDMQEGLGPDHDPFWFTDITVRSGATYQYRLSMVLLNQYAGIASLLKNPQDARKLLVQGEWSPWTKAITVPRSKWLFVTSIPQGEGKVGVELNEWLGGKWEKAPHSLAMGEVASITRGHIVLNYGAVLVSADASRPFQRRTEIGKGETFKYENGPAGAAVFVTETGVVEEHFMAADADARNNLNQQIAQERKQREAAAGGETGRPATVTPKPAPARRPTERDRGPDRLRSPEGERRSRGRGG